MRRLAPVLTPQLVERHAVELAAVAPGLSPAPVTLTELAPPQERTRWYSRLRTRRISHGIVDLLLALDAGDVTFVGVDEADATDVEFIEVARQRGLSLHTVGESSYVPESGAPEFHDRRFEELAAQGELFGAVLHHWRGGSRYPSDVYKRAIEGCMAEAFYAAGLELVEQYAQFAAPEEHYWVQTQRADFLFLLGRPDEVEPIYYDLLSRSASPFRHMTISYALAMLYTRLYGPDRKDHHRARAHVNTAIALASRLDDPFHLVFMHNGKALVEMHLGNLEESLRLVTEGIALLDEKLAPDKHLLHRSVLKHNRGQVLAALGRNEAAIEEFTQVIAVDPNYPEYRFDRGNLLNRMGRFSEALADYEAAMRLGPPFAELYHNRGDLRLTMGDTDSAIADFKRALELEPDHVESRIALMSLVPAAEAVSLAGSHEDARLRCALGLSLLELDLPAEAREAFTDALRLDPGLTEALVNRAVAAFTLGEGEAALDDLSSALDLDPGNPDVLFNRGFALEAAGRFEPALADYRRALTDSRADREAVLDGLARCEGALGCSERVNK